MVTVIGGNIFINCMILGIGEIISGIVSIVLLKHYKDTTVFIAGNVFVAIFNSLFYFVPTGIPQYACLFMTIFGVATQFNTIYVLVEHRVPPENAGSAIVIVTTCG